MKYEFSKLELWWEGVEMNTIFGELLHDKNAPIMGYSVVKVFERRWYNPFRWILAKHSVVNIPKEKFFKDQISHLQEQIKE